MKTLHVVVALVSSIILSSAQSRGEDWKGSVPGNTFTTGVMTGLAPVLGELGYALLWHGGVQMMKDGFIPDVADSVFLETELGGNWIEGPDLFFWSLHLRWDFYKNATWGLFALAGFHGVNSSTVSNIFVPRVGVGALYNLGGIFDVRFEFSHELVGVGVQIPLFL